MLTRAIGPSATNVGGGPRTGMPWLAVSGLLLVGATAGWAEPGWRFSDGRSATSPPTPSARAERPSPDPLANPVMGIPQPQAEAAALKREAVAVATQVAEAYPEDALAYALLGSASYNTGHAEEAARHLKRCLELNPNQVDAYAVLARVAYDRGDLVETVSLCQEALRRGPPSSEVLNRLGRALMDLGRTAEAAQALQQAVRLPEPTSESHYLLGQASLQSGDYPQAKENFQRAIGLLPDHTQAFFGLYTASLRLGLTEEATRYREQFQKLEAADRRSLTDRSAQEDTLTGLPLVRQTVARTFFGAAQIHRLHGRAELAAGLLRKSASLDPENLLYRATLEADFVQRKALPEGVAVFQQLAAEQPTNSLNYLFLGRLQGRLRQVDAAEVAYRKVQELAPRWAEGYRALAELNLRANRNLAEALALARKAAELEPSGSHYYLLAVLSLRNEDRAGARTAASKAVALSPDQNEYQEFLQHLEAMPRP